MPGATAGKASRPRTRLGVDERREQLLQIGMELFSTRPYEEIWIGEIAEAAGVSRGLLYHYFPNKRDFFVAVTRRAVEEIAQATAPDPELAGLDQLRHGVGAYVAYARDHREAYLATHRGTLSGDPELRAVIEAGRVDQVELIAAAVAAGRPVTDALRLAIRGWMMMLLDVTVEWVERDRPSREVVTDMLVLALVGVVAAAVRADPELDIPLPDLDRLVAPS